MKTKTIKVYQFNELSKEIKEKVINEYVGINVDCDWWVFSLEDITEQIKEKTSLNINPEKINFDLNRGLKMYIEDSVLLSSLCEKYKYLENIDLTAKFGVFTNDLGGGMCSSLKYSDLPTEDMIDLDIDDDTPELKKAVIENIYKDKIINDLNEIHLILEQGIKDLWEDYNNLQSEEAIKETIEANEYGFNENGERA